MMALLIKAVAIDRVVRCLAVLYVLNVPYVMCGGWPSRSVHLVAFHGEVAISRDFEVF